MWCQGLEPLAAFHRFAMICCPARRLSSGPACITLLRMASFSSLSKQGCLCSNETNAHASRAKYDVHVSVLALPDHMCFRSASVSYKDPGAAQALLQHWAMCSWLTGLP